MAVAAATTFVVAAQGPAHAADEITCKPTASLWAARTNEQLSLHAHNEPETGVDSWVPYNQNGNGWPTATWAGLDGRMYYINGTSNALERHRWLGTRWENNAVSTPILDNMSHYAHPDHAKRFTIDPTGAFYLVGADGELWRRTYDENTKVWNSTPIDSGWDRYDRIFAAGEGVLWAREPGGQLFRFRYHVESQRWLQYRMPVGGPWNDYKYLTSPGADVIYAVRKSDNAIIWYRYHESTRQLTPGTLAGFTFHDATTAVAAPDGCRRVDEPNPGRPNLGAPDRLAKASLLKATDGNLQYAYIDSDGKAVHAKVTDLYTGPNGFIAMPTSGFTGAPALAQNRSGETRLWAQGTDADARGFRQVANGSWAASTDDNGRMVTPPQTVVTGNGVTMVAFAEDGTLWAKFPSLAGDALYPWRQLTMQPIAATRHFTAFSTNGSIHVVALRTSGEHCKIDISIPQGSAGEWSCSGQSATGAVAVLRMPSNTVQLFARRTDGRIYTIRFPETGPIPSNWVPMDGALAGGASAAGDPAALLAPNGTLQVLVRGSDGYIHRTGQTASGSTRWTAWTEVTSYTTETAVDPTVSLAQDTWVVAFRTPAGEPKLLRWQPDPNVAATKTSNGIGGFAEVPLKG